MFLVVFAVNSTRADWKVTFMNFRHVFIWI